MANLRCTCINACFNMYLFLFLNDIGEMSIRNSWVEFTLKKMEHIKVKECSSTNTAIQDLKV